MQHETFGGTLGDLQTLLFVNNMNERLPRVLCCEIKHSMFVKFTVHCICLYILQKLCNKIIITLSTCWSLPSIM